MLNKLFSLVLSVGLMLAACGRSEVPASQVATSQAAASPAAAGAASQAVAKGILKVENPRVVSVAPAATLMLCQLGAVDTLVGISSYDRLVLPEGRRELPVVGDYLNFNYEALLATRPTAIVVQMADDRMAPRLKELAADRKIQLVNIRLDTVADMQATARRLAALTGREAVVEGKLAAIEGHLRQLDKAVAALGKPKVLYVVRTKPLIVVGAHRFMDEMLTRAGAVNVAAAAGEDFPQLTMEQIAKMGPEVILLAAPDEPAPLAGTEADDPRLGPWLGLPIPAARNQRVYLVTESNSQLNSLDLDEHTLTLAKLIHPELKGWAFGTGGP